MSSYLVNDSHIHLLVNAGLGLTQPGISDKLAWIVRDLTDEEKAVGYQRGAAWGPGAQEIYGKLRRQLTRENAGWVGAMLLAENQRSVNHRYNEEEWENPYIFKVLRGVPNPVAVLKALDGYEYQACEHPEWEASEAYKFCASLRKLAIKRLSGYEDAEWEYTESTLARALVW